MSGRKNHLQENYRRYWKRYRNIIYDVWMQILNDLGFSGYVVSLYVVVVIFRKRILMESGT